MNDLSIAIVNFNGRGVIEQTLAAIDALTVDVAEVLLVDDGSTDDTLEWVRQHHPNVRVVSMGRNTQRTSKVRNRALAEAGGRYVMLIDNDVVLNDGCIAALQSTIESRDDVLCCTPRLLFHDDASKVYHDGGRLHFLALSCDMVRGVPAKDLPPRPPRPTIASGIMLIDRVKAREMGGFDEGYLFGWGDDGEFQARGVLRGHRVLHVSEACCLHVQRSHGSSRAYAQLYNRYRFMLIVYSTRTLLLLLPSIIVFECVLALVGVLRGFAGCQWRALRATIRDRREIMRRRHEVQSTRRASDRELLCAGRLYTGSADGGSRISAMGAQLWSGALAMYWKCVSWALESSTHDVPGPVSPTVDQAT